MTQLTLALDKAVGTRNNNLQLNTPERQMNQIKKPPLSGSQDSNINSGAYSSIKKAPQNRNEFYSKSIEL